MAKDTHKQNYDSWPKKVLKITDLFLDTENIRLDTEIPLSHQDALINDLFSNEDAMQILKSIASNGFFPDEVPVVVKENNKIIVLEGNRRIAALKALLRPEIVPSKEPSIKNILRDKDTVPIPKELQVVIAPNRDSAMVFLATKHTLNTRRRWRPLRQAYFYKAQLERGKNVQKLRNEYPTVDISKFLRLINIHRIAKSFSYDSEAITKKVHNEHSFPASTIERLYENKQVRDFLGFDFDGDGEVKITINKDEFEKGFKKVIQDVVEKNIDSRALNKEKDIKNYLARFEPEFIPKMTKSDKIHTSKDFKEKTTPFLLKRKSLAPNDIIFSLQSPGVRRMLIELQTINYHKFPNATHDLLRSFLECALKAYFFHCGKTITPARQPYVHLEDVLKEFKSEMDQNKNKELAQVTQKIMDGHSMNSYTVQALNAKNHNPSIFTSDTEVLDAWEIMEKLFRYILNPSKKVK